MGLGAAAPTSVIRIGNPFTMLAKYVGAIRFGGFGLGFPAAHGRGTLTLLWSGRKANADEIKTFIFNIALTINVLYVIMSATK